MNHNKLTPSYRQGRFDCLALMFLTSLTTCELRSENRYLTQLLFIIFLPIFLVLRNIACISVTAGIVSRGDWLGNPANIKVENNGAVGYVGSSLTLHNPLFSLSYKL